MLCAWIIDLLSLRHGYGSDIRFLLLIVFCSSLWIKLIEGMLAKVNWVPAAENVVALCLTERLNQGVVQVSMR